MFDRLVNVTAPSRLHFGLFSFGRTGERQFGGVGLMIDQPSLCLEIVPATQFEAAGVLAERVIQFIDRWMEFHGRAGRPPCRIVVRSAPPQHSGLGAGTQLGLSLAAGMNAFYGLMQVSPTELAISVGRGLRSAVGTYGFAQGGLIVERGKLASETISPLDCRLDLPEDWCVALIQPTSDAGLSGEAEQQAFDQLPPVPQSVTEQLIDEVRLYMLPAAARGDFDEFGESVYRYGRLAGTTFASIQGGPYNGPHLERLVNRVQSLGVRGVGQSSWGPTLFALLPDQDSAANFRTRLLAEVETESIVVTLSSLNQTGAAVTVSDD